jgi:hypothetical protein
MSIEKSIDLIGIRTRDLPACSIVPQPTMLPRAPQLHVVVAKQVVTNEGISDEARLSIAVQLLCELKHYCTAINPLLMIQCVLQQ